jgi:hypothetical protein
MKGIGGFGMTRFGADTGVGDRPAPHHGPSGWTATWTGHGVTVFVANTH